MRTKAWFTKDNRNHKYLFSAQLTTAETRFCSRLFLHMMKGAIFLKPKQQLFVTLLVIIGTLFNHLPVTASAFNFSVTPITSENQIDKRKTYFDLQLVPDQDLKAFKPWFSMPRCQKIDSMVYWPVGSHSKKL